MAMELAEVVRESFNALDDVGIDDVDRGAIDADEEEIEEEEDDV